MFLCKHEKKGRSKWPTRARAGGATIAHRRRCGSWSCVACVVADDGDRLHLGRLGDRRNRRRADGAGARGGARPSWRRRSASRASSTRRTPPCSSPRSRTRAPGTATAPSPTPGWTSPRRRWAGERRRRPCRPADRDGAAGRAGGEPVALKKAAVRPPARPSRAERARASIRRWTSSAARPETAGGRPARMAAAKSAMTSRCQSCGKAMGSAPPPVPEAAPITWCRRRGG